MNSAQDILLLFTKYPLAGKSKTRLIPALGKRGAAQLQKVMTQSITAILQKLVETEYCYLEIHYEGGNQGLMQQWLGASLNYKPQHKGDLGQRMASAFAAHLGRYQSIILLGSDCPDINRTILKEGLTRLKDHDIVIGPAFDGGYYLIGIKGTLNRDCLDFLFAEIDWGEEQVLNQTLTRIEKKQLRYHLLKKLHDIDTPEDLKHFDNYPNPQ